MRHKKLEVPCHGCANRIPPSAESKGCRSTCSKWKEYETLYQEIINQPENVEFQEYAHERSIKIKRAMKNNKRRM